MKTFRRFALLGLFAAAGMGLAIYLGTSASSPQQPEPAPAQSGLVAIARASGPQAPEGSPASPAPLPAETADQAVAASRCVRNDRPGASEDLRLVAPSGPLAAQYVPPPPGLLAQASKPSRDDALEFLRQQLTPTAPSPSPIPPPPLPAGGSAAPGRPARSADSLLPGGNSAPAAKAAKSVVKADPEGDGKLSIHIQNGEIREVLDLLSEQGGLNILAGKDVQGKVSATLTGVDIQSALEAILKSTGYASRRQGKFIFVGTPEEFNSMEQALDRVGTRVYRPNYVTAAELKTLIQPLLTEKIGLASVSTPAEAGIGANDTTVGGDKYAGGDVVLVRDYEAVLAQIDQVVSEVDVRPLQVSIEAMILSIRLNDTNEFGVDFSLLRDHMAFGWGTPLSTLVDFPFKGGLKFGYLDGNVGVFLNALEQIADTNVVAKPSLMVLNKQRAEILIGDKKGYVSTTVTETASTQTIDFLEVGAQLRLRPFISRDGLIRMEVHPELSDGTVEVVDKMTLPQKSVTQVTSNIMVRDGCTVVIGGLLKEQLTNSTTAIPLLGSLPWIGAAFRDTKETTERREVIVLITPRIVYEPGTCRDGEKGACEFERRQAVYAEKMSPLGRRHIARRYLRLAQSAWAQGDRDTALRFAEMAVQFDPISGDAIDLRARIWQGSVTDGVITAPDAPAPAPGGPAAAPPAGAEPIGPGLIDGPQVAPWVIDDLARESPQQPAVLHPLDPGQPGMHKEIVRPRRLQ